MKGITKFLYDYLIYIYAVLDIFNNITINKISRIYKKDTKGNMALIVLMIKTVLVVIIFFMLMTTDIIKNCIKAIFSIRLD